VKIFNYLRLFQNFSFEKATIDLNEKSGIRPIFQEQFPKLTEFCNIAHFTHF